MKRSMWKIAIVALALATAVACNKKSSDGASVQTGRDQRGAGLNSLPTGQGSVGTQSANIVFNQTQTAEMTKAIRTLVSPTLPDPQAVGDVQSVEVSGSVGVQSNGQVLADSGIELVIRDSYVGTSDGEGVIEPIKIRVRGSTTGTAFNGTANLTFTDQYGSITVTGSWTPAGSFTGTVAFRNKTAAASGDAAGTLGQFTIPTCAFFRCVAQ